MRWLCVAAVVMATPLVAACDGNARVSKDGLRQPVRLVQAPSTLTDQCANAANLLGFPVPCPRMVPHFAGKAMSCRPPNPAQEST